MRKVARVVRWSMKAWPLVLAIVATVLGAALWPVVNRPPSDLGVQAKARVNEIIYPTFGNPAIVERGAELTAEFDPRNRGFDRPFVHVRKFTVNARTAGSPYPAAMDLPVRMVREGPSARWPEYAAAKDEDRRVYRVTVEVPRALPEDLYDIVVTARLRDGGEIADIQPHSLQAVNGYKDDFSFVQLTDVHLFGPECSFGSAVYHLRDDRQDGKDPGKKGAVYYQRAIDQINLMKPDFCVFTGDAMYGQAYFLQDQGPPWGLTTEYEYEMTWFYEETLRLDVPVFMMPGNHESFAEGKEGAREDWFENWRRLFGPLYYSFDYGRHHFLALNAQDWPVSERTLYDYGVSIQSEKYKGQFSSGGDKWAPGVSPGRLDGVDESKLGGQLAWMRDDLESHQDSRIRVVATHQDPWRREGSGQMWASKGSDSAGVFGAIKTALGFGGKYGDGAGRLAAIKLMSEYRVALEISGHFHSDFLEVFPWRDATGEVICANTTCAQFNVDGPSRSYPGYRRIRIKDGRVAEVNYADPFWSYPLYAGTNVGGITDLAKLEAPAIGAAYSTLPGSADDVTLTISNSLDRALPGAYGEFPMPYLSGGGYYRVTGGVITQARDVEEGTARPGTRVFDVRADVPPGWTAQVRVFVSAVPDKAPPAGTVAIGAGYPTTGPGREVVLNLEANDTGGSGVKDMMISNSAGFEGTRWEPYRKAVRWRLAGDGAGGRPVYVRFRDYAMPPNISTVAASPPGT